MDNNQKPLFEPAKDITEVPPKRKRAGTVQVVLIQSVCCAVFLLLFWLFRLTGGSGYEQLKTAFENAFQNNALLETISGLFNEQTPDENYLLSGVTTEKSSETTTANADATQTTASTETVATDNQTKGTSVD